MFIAKLLMEICVNLNMNIRKGHNTNSHKEVDNVSLESLFLNSPISNMFRYSILFF